MLTGPSSPSRTLRRGVAAGLLLLVHSAATSGLLSLLVAVVAWLDGQHSVLVRAQRGGVAVVLVHDAGSPKASQRSPGHQHNPLSRVLSAFAEQCGGESDHVLHFNSARELRARQDCLVGTPSLLPVEMAAFVAAAPPRGAPPQIDLRSAKLRSLAFGPPRLQCVVLMI